jgi:nucleoside-diphosphate-sugar epimerase
MLKKNILITGATGFVGSAVVEILIRENFIFSPIAALRTPLDLKHKYFAPTKSVIVGSIDGETDWSAALAGVASVVHTAARVHVMADTSPNPLDDFRKVNVDGTLNLARQAAAVGVRRFVFLSSVKVNGEQTFTGKAFAEDDDPSPQDFYGQSKYEAELGLRQLAKDSGMEVVIIRPPLVYGPGVKANFAALMRAVQRGLPLPLGSVNNQRSLVALNNLVHLIVTCLRHPAAANQTFLVSDGQDISTAELLRSMARAARVSDRLWPVPVWALQAAASAVGKGAAVQRLCGNLQVDISKARTLLGWLPVVTMDEQLAKMFEHKD